MIKFTLSKILIVLVSSINISFAFLIRFINNFLSIELIGQIILIFSYKI